MKKWFFFFGVVVLGVLGISSNNQLKANTIGFNAQYQVSIFERTPLQGNDLAFENYVEDILEDETSETEEEKTFLGTTLTSPFCTLFGTLHIYTCYFKKYLIHQAFVGFKTALFLFICVLRI